MGEGQETAGSGGGAGESRPQGGEKKKKEVGKRNRGRVGEM